jgi:endoplasmic reticulum junction formation protein lunapark
MTAVSPSPPGPPRKQWFDKLADVVLGEEDSARFALICEKCFAHNGLVKESVWDNTRKSYINYCAILLEHTNRIRLSELQALQPFQKSEKTSRYPTLFFEYVSSGG